MEMCEGAESPMFRSWFALEGQVAVFCRALFRSRYVKNASSTFGGGGGLRNGCKALTFWPKVV